jgi:tetratricopeptide (TPR) repeat protein
VAFTNGPYFLTLLVLAAALYSLVRFRRDRWWLLAWGWYLASIFFLLRFDDLADGNIVADRFMYLPSLGFCFWFGSLPGRVRAVVPRERPGWFPLAAAGFLAVFVFLSARTYAQACLWGDEMKLWSYAIAREPGSMIAYNSRGNLYSRRGEYGAALADYTRAVELRPIYAQAYDNRGIVYYRLGRYDAALRDFNRALAIRPTTLPSAYSNRGLVYDKMGKDALALSDYKRALHFDPDDAGAYNNRGKFYYSRGGYTQALRNFNRAVSLEPDFALAYMNRGNVFFVRGDYRRALEDYTLALGRDRRLGGAYYNRGLAYLKLGDRPRAEQEFQRARVLGFPAASGKGESHDNSR